MRIIDLNIMKTKEYKTKQKNIKKNFMQTVMVDLPNCHQKG
jgi:hypothetical protein